MPRRAGAEYVFTVTVSKGSDGGAAWSQYRSDNASCFVSTSAIDTPLVSIIPKVSFPCLWSGTEAASGLARIRCIQAVGRQQVRKCQLMHACVAHPSNLCTLCLTVNLATFVAATISKVQPFFAAGSIRMCRGISGGPMHQSHRSRV